jgi:hypothetical protein
MDAAPTSGQAWEGRARRERDFRRTTDEQQPYILNGQSRTDWHNEALHRRADTHDRAHDREWAHTNTYVILLRGTLTRGTAF